MRGILWGLAMLSCVGCLGRGAGNGDDADDTVGALVGDWFLCMDAACTTIDDDGLRFRDDGTWLGLEGDDQPVSEAPICVVKESAGGTFFWDGEVLELDDGRAAMTRFATRTGDRLRLEDNDGGEPIFFVRVETFDADTCRTADDGPEVEASSHDPLPNQPPSVADFHGRADIYLTPDGLSASGGARIDGEAFTAKTVITGTLLVVVQFDGQPHWVRTAIDPRNVNGARTESEGLITFRFPGDYFATEATLDATDFEVLELDPAIALDTEVSLDNLEALRAGAVSLGVVRGSAFSAFLFP